MTPLIGLLIIALGSFGQSSSYVPIKRVRQWSWESFWFVQGIFAWLVFPLVGTLAILPSGVSMGDIYAIDPSALLGSVGYGALWGVGGLTFGLSMRYLGVALGQSLALGTCSAFGTLIPALMKGGDLFSGSGLVLLTGVGLAVAGIAVIGYAGALRNRAMTEEEKRAAVKDFALKKGLLIALLAGVMSACFNLGLEAGAGVREQTLALGISPLLALNPVILLVTLGGLATNAAYCIWQNARNGTWRDYTTASAGVWANNLFFCALAGVLWYTQFFGLGLGQSFFEPGSVLMAFSWSILMSLNVLFSNVWGILLREWHGAGRASIVVLCCGLAVLILSIVYPQIL